MSLLKLGLKPLRLLHLLQEFKELNPFNNELLVRRLDETTHAHVAAGRNIKNAAGVKTKEATLPVNHREIIKTDL